MLVFLVCLLDLETSSLSIVINPEGGEGLVKGKQNLQFKDGSNGTGTRKHSKNYQQHVKTKTTGRNYAKNCEWESGIWYIA